MNRVFACLLVLIVVGIQVRSIEAQEDFLVSNNVVKDYDGNVYETVLIGSQVWLSENLRSERFQDGSKIDTAFIPDDDSSKLSAHGRLYSWHDVADRRNICPVGWRVATDEDWKALERAIGLDEDEVDDKGWRGDGAALSLKANQSKSIFDRFDSSIVNQVKFNARPSGIKWKRWYFAQGMYSEFWTGSSATENKAYNRTLAYSWWSPQKGKIYRSALSKDYMFSVRCIKE